MQRKKSAPRSKPTTRPIRVDGRAELSQAQEIWLEFFNLYSGMTNCDSKMPNLRQREIDETVTSAAYFADRALDAFETRWGEVKLPEED